MATSEPARRGYLAVLMVAVVIATTLVVVAAATGSHKPAAAATWRHATISSGAATVSYPSTWKAIPGDAGTVSFALRDKRGRYRGYLNVTPRQGAERLSGWATFRTRRNAEDGDGQVRIVSAAENVAFIHAHGSCVTDDYISRVGGHRYRELACIVQGRRSTSVFVGAALAADWPKLEPVVRHAAATLVER